MVLGRQNPRWKEMCNFYLARIGLSLRDFPGGRKRCIYLQGEHWMS